MSVNEVWMSVHITRVPINSVLMGLHGTIADARLPVGMLLLLV